MLSIKPNTKEKLKTASIIIVMFKWSSNITLVSETNIAPFIHPKRP